MQTVQGCRTHVYLDTVDVAQINPAPNIPRTNVTPAHADADPTQHVLERGWSVYQEVAKVRMVFTNEFQELS